MPPEDGSIVRFDTPVTAPPPGKVAIAVMFVIHALDPELELDPELAGQLTAVARPAASMVATFTSLDCHVT